MLIPVRTMTDILNQNTGFAKYSVAWLMNMSEPVITVSTKAVQVNGRSWRESSAKGRLTRGKAEQAQVHDRYRAKLKP